MKMVTIRQGERIIMYLHTHNKETHKLWSLHKIMVGLRQSNIGLMPSK